MCKATLRLEVVLTVLLALAWCGSRLESVEFTRGDVDANGSLQITDSVLILSHLFVAPQDIGCEDASDVNDTGDVDITDGIYGLNFLFLGGPPPAEPFPACGDDPSVDTLGCERYGACDTDPTFELHLVTAGGFTGKGTGDLHLEDGVLLVRNPFGQPRECSAEISADAFTRLAEAADVIDWSTIEDRYVPPKNPNCCCDQIVSELRVDLDEEGVKLTTSWCDQSAGDGLVPRELLDLVLVLREIGGVVSETCSPEER